MSMETELVNLMRNDTALAALIAARIYPLELPQGVTLPACTYQVIGGDPTNSFDGPSDLDAMLVQIDAWALSYSGVIALAKAVRKALDGGQYENIQEIICTNPGMDVGEFEPHEDGAKVYRRTLEFEVAYEVEL